MSDFGYEPRPVAGIVRTARRPPGWLAPGPQPRGGEGRPELEPADDEDLCFLTGEWRLFQKQRGHRWSMDDLLTAWVAAPHLEVVRARSALDLGCGLGSVLLMNAWRFPQLDVTGVEAQADRAEMGRRSIAWNGVEARCRIVTGDLREPGVLPADARFDVVTGTPPYFPLGTGSESEKSHAVPCRFEVRGGVESYIAAADRWLAPHGRFVVCTASMEAERVEASLNAHRFHHLERLVVIPREGKAPLLHLDVLSKIPGTFQQRSITVRDRKAQWTTEFRVVRAAMGMPSPQ